MQPAATLGRPLHRGAARAGETVKSALRVLLIIELLTEEESGQTFAQICERLELPKSSSHALLRTMTERGHLVLDAETRRYRLGVRLWQAGNAYAQSFDLAEVSRPYLQAARDMLQETVQLAILDGIENVYLAKEDADQRLVLQSKVGARLPAYATGLGKVLLSGLGDDEVLARLAGTVLHPFSPSTITDPARLLEVLAEIRRRGYGTDHGEYTEGVVCVAVPICDDTGGIVAAMSVSVPEIRAGAQLQERAIEVLQREAARLSSRLGHARAITR